MTVILEYYALLGYTYTRGRDEVIMLQQNFSK